MKEKVLIEQISDHQRGEGDHPEIRALMARLSEITPIDMARALYHLESFSKIPQIFMKSPQGVLEETQMYFSRGLKSEVEEIYLELAKHLRAKSRGSVDLMNAVFDFFSQTLHTMVEIPHLISMN